MNEMQHRADVERPMTTARFTPELLREKARARHEPEWLVEARLQALATYEKLEAPRYLRTDLRSLDIPTLALRASGEEPTGLQRATIRQEGVIHMPLSEAAREHEDLVRPLIGTGLAPDATKWDALHAALWSEGHLLHVAKGVEVAEPITTTTRITPAGALVRDVIALEPLSRATLIDRWLDGGAADAATPTLATNSLDIRLGDNSSLQLSLVQELSASTTLLSTRRAAITRDARLAWIDGQFGGATSVTVNESRLLEQGAKINFFGAFFGGEKQHFDITTSALHRAKHTESQLNMRGALNENGYAANYSIVFISEDAPSSSGHQHQETLILGEGARADAIPKLDVENNDVSASHGATVGQVDPDQVFYLRARGLDEQAAKRLIVEGFFEPLLREIPLESVRDEIALAIVSRLK